MAATPRQIESNRRNAQRSTGPRTARGRRNQRAAVTRHGLKSDAPVLPSIGEKAADWRAYRQSVVDDLQPVGPVETALVERVARLLWKSARFDRYETANLNQRLDDVRFHVDDRPHIAALRERLPASLNTDVLAEAKEHAEWSRIRLESLDAFAALSDGEALSAEVCADVMLSLEEWAYHMRSVLDDADPLATRLATLMGDEFARLGIPDDPDTATVGDWTVARLRAAITAVAVALDSLFATSYQSAPLAALRAHAKAQADKDSARLKTLKALAERERMARVIPDADTHAHLSRYDADIHGALGRALGELRQLQARRSN